MAMTTTVFFYALRIMTIRAMLETRFLMIWILTYLNKDTKYYDYIP